MCRMAFGRDSAGAQRGEFPLFYYGWVNVLVAALMVNATLPARTHGLGLITKSVLEDLAMTEITFAWFNFASVLIGSLFCVPLGRLIDRFGSRLVLTAIMFLFGLVTLWTAFIDEAYSLFAALTISRGLAQAGITVGAGALVGKWFTRHVGYAMAIYAILMGAGFVVCTWGAGQAVMHFGWRETWATIGLLVVVVVTPIAALLTRSEPPFDEPEIEPLQSPAMPAALPHVRDYTLLEAIATPAFWVFTLAYSMFALSWAAVTLFNELILEERGFGGGTFILMMTILPVGGALAQLGAGWLANNWRLGGVMALGMFCLAASMGGFPFLTQTWQVVLYALGLGFAGSFIMVSHLAFYPRAFGRAHLGQVNGAAQVVYIVISAAGPVILTYCKAYSGSYATMFFGAAAVMLGLGVSSWFVPMPRRAE